MKTLSNDSLSIFYASFILLFFIVFFDPFLLFQPTELLLDNSSFIHSFPSIFFKPSAWDLNSPYSLNKLIYFFFSSCQRFLFFLISLGTIFFIQKKTLKLIIKGFFFLFILSSIAFLISANSSLSVIGIGYPFTALFIGLVFRFLFGLPSSLQTVTQTEFFMKAGLVLLGAEILFPKLLAIGLPGVFIAWLVTPIVFISTVLFGQKVLRLPQSLNFVISADMSVCGLSAAMVTAQACKAKKEELITALSLSLVFTSLMMIILPFIIQLFNINPIIGGAWIGGTIDSTGAVALASQALGESAMVVATTIKMIQNILIGALAFVLALYFSCNSSSLKPTNKEGFIVSLWKHFPRFIIGFFVFSILFSLIYTYGPDISQEILEKEVIGQGSKNIRMWLFCFAFLSIGLHFDFYTIRKTLQGGKSLILYLTGQTFNLILTFIVSYLMFSVFFPSSLSL